MALLVDIRDLLKSGSQLQEERDKPVTLAVFVEADAPLAAVEILQDRFRQATRTTFLQMELLQPDTVAAAHPDTDAVVVLVGGGGQQAFDALRDVLREGIPLAVVGTSPTVESLARRAGVPSSDTLMDPYAAALIDVQLGDWLVDRVAGKRLALAHNFPFLRRQVAEEAVKATSWQNAMIGAIAVIPGADMPLMTANQAKMLLQIAAAYGQKLGSDRVRELAAVVGGGFAFRAIARQGLTLLPGFGWALKGAVGWAGTVAMGRAAIEYFEQGADMRQVTERLKEARSEIAARARELRGQAPSRRELTRAAPAEATGSGSPHVE